MLHQLCLFSLKTSLQNFQQYLSVIILPLYGSHKFVSDNDALIIYHLLHCQKLNLPYIIIHNMIASTTRYYKRLSVSYGMVLTKIVKYFNVPLKIEKYFIKISKLSSKNISNMKKDPSLPAHYKCPSIFILRNQSPTTPSPSKQKIS